MLYYALCLSYHSNAEAVLFALFRTRSFPNLDFVRCTAVVNSVLALVNFYYATHSRYLGIHYSQCDVIVKLRNLFCHY